MRIPDSPTHTILVAELVPGDRVIVPMVGNVETVTKNDDGLVSTDGTGPDSAYMWHPGDPIDVIDQGYALTRPNPPASPEGTDS